MNTTLRTFSGNQTTTSTATSSLRNYFVKLLVGVLFVLGGLGTSAQIAVTVTGTAVTSPALAPTYTSLALALADVNAIASYTTPGTIILTCTAGGSETVPTSTGLTLGSATLDPLLSATNTITINTTGGVVTLNAAVGVAGSPSATPDCIMKLSGADFVTIDGLTFTDGNSATAAAAMEVGLGFFKRAAGDGCNNNTVQNCIFNMQRISNGGGTTPMLDGSWAIEVLNSTAAAATTSLTPTNGGTSATNGTNSGNKFYNNTINGGNGGIGFGGFAAVTGVGPSPTATTFLGDLGNDVGGVALATGNSILNFGGGAVTSPSAGIRANNEWSINIQYNTVNNNNGSGVNHATTLRGIYGQAGTSANATISNNIITIQSAATTSTINCIDNAIGSTAAGNTITITNNTINVNYTTATTGVMNGIINSATAATVNINFNSITKVAGGDLAGTGTHIGIETGSPTTASANNNSITNLTRSGASGSWRGIKMTSPTNITINNNTIDGLSWTTAASTGSIDAIYSISSAVNVTANNNIIRNLSTPTTGTITGINEFGVSGLKTYQNNQIYNFFTTAGGAGGATFRGISESTGSTNTYSGNIIYSLNSAGSTGGSGGSITGIIFSSGTTNNVSNNAIYDLSSTSTSPVISGINIGGGTTANINNNLIGDLRATASTGNTSISGILSASGTTNNIYHNTVNISSTTASATTFGTSAIYFSSSSPVNNLRNNVFVNTSVPGPTGGFSAAIRYTAAPTSTNFPAANNNNFYYAGVPAANSVIYGEGSAAAATNGQQTIANYKTYINTTLPVSGREAASVSEIPNFVSTTGSNPVTTFLQYNTGSATQIEQGGGLGTGVSTDYAGTTRCPGGGCPGAASTPDMGAWELNGLILDLTPPAISYTALSNSCVSGARTLTATISDPSGVPTTGVGLPVAYFNINGGSYTPVTGTFVSGSTYTFSIGTGSNGGDVIAYYIVAQDNAGTPNVGAFPSAGASGFTANPPVASTPPTTPSSYTNLTILAAGTYGVGGPPAVGEIGHYNTLTLAVADYNSKCLGGNIIFALTNGGGAETFPIVINANPAADPTHTLTIRPDATITASITNSTASAAIIKLNGANYVTIDGSNSGGTSRDLTISNTNTTSPTAISIASLGVGLGATNNTIKNCNISAGTGVSAGTGWGISVGGATPGTNGADNDNTTIQNNNITLANVSIFASGAAAVSAGGDDNLQIAGNTVNSNSTIQNQGIQVGNALNSGITSNTVSVISSVGGSPVGISLETGFVSSTVTKNIITNALTTSTGGWGGRGITVGTGTAASNLTIANNVIYGVNGSNFSSFTNSSSAGIMIGTIGGSSTLTTTTGGVNLYFNGVNMSGSMGSGSATAITAALYVGSGASALNIRNNAFVNTQVATSATQKNYGIYSVATNTAFTTIDLNDYFVSNSFNAASAIPGFIGSDRTNLAGIQAGFGQNTGSIIADPLFQSNTDLRPGLGSPLGGAANTSGTGITTDILGVTRNAGTPPTGATIGAYETLVDAAGPVITYTPLAGLCGSGARTLTTTITDASGVPTSGAGLPVAYFKINAGAYTPVTGTYVSGNTYTFSIGTGSVAGDVVTYYIVAQDQAATPNVSASPSAGAGGFTINPPAAATPPTTPNSYTNLNTMAAGIYGVGGPAAPGEIGHYTTLTLAAADYNTKCIGGNIIFALTDPTYSGAETFPININANPNADNAHTLTIQPAPGVSSAITGSSAVSIISLNGADYVTINGSNGAVSNTVCPPSAATRNLTITNTSATTTSAVVWLGTTAGGDPVTNCAVQNCILIGNAPTTTLLGLGAGGAGVGTAATGNNSNLSFINNDIRACQFAIYSAGASGASKNQGITINQNFINTASPNNILEGGIYVAFTNNVTISGNTVGNIINSNSSQDPVGINVGFGVINGFSTTTTGLGDGASNVTITNNTIGTIQHSATYSAVGIGLGNTISGTSLIANNMISGVAGNGTSGDFSGGIVLGGGTAQVNVYYNTVVMQGTIPGASSASQTAACLAVTSGTASPIDIKNNIFVNKQLGNAGATVKLAAIALGYASPYTGLSSNNNDLFAAGAGPGTYTVGVTGGVVGTNRVTLANWQSQTGGDGASKNVSPVFVSAADLHLVAADPANATLDGGGTPVSVTADIDCAVRDANLPDIGADEFCLTPTAGAPSSTPTLCVNTALTPITITTTGATGITNDGVSGANGLPAGVSATWANNTITISGTPTTAVGSPFNYSIPMTGGCSIVNATGIITVTAANTASAASSTPTLCISTLMTNITHTTTGATGIANDAVDGANGLPAGTSATWSGGTITISGTPTAAGTFNYSILLTGGCGSVSATGTITVTAANTASAPSSTPTLCINTALTPITHTTTGATGISGDGVDAANGLPPGTSATWSGNTITISGTPTLSGTFNYSIPLTGGCGSVSATGAITVTAANTASGPSSTPTVCINTAITNITHTTTGATGIANDGVSGANGLPAGVSATWSAGTITISGTPTAAGTFNYSILLTGGCGAVSATGTITVTAANTASGPSSTPTLCINTVLTNITHTTTGATGIANDGVSGANGLPAGVSATWSGGTITISGTPTTAGTFNYSILLTGGCGSVSATGTITVTAANTASGPSSTPTVCINTAITNITHTTTGATGIANDGVSGANGLPAGVSATWSGGTITISGTPTAAGTFNYSILLTGGCGAVSATGTITVTAANTASGPSSTPTVCINTAITNITHTTTGATGIANDGVSGANGLPAGVSATWSAGTITISGTPTAAGTFNYSILLTGGCGSVSATGTITVTAANTASGPSSTPTLCINTVLTNITHTTTGATGIANDGVSGANGLPAGVSATWSAGTITISGTPTAAGTFNYSILLTGGCGSVSATGTITVTAANTASGPSSTPTVCINTAITNITHTTTGATGIANSGVSGANGLPAGVSATWSGGTITISGTPTVSGVFNYSILLTGGCGAVSATGTITVTANNTASGASSNPSVCLNTAISPNITITTTGATGIANDGVSGANGLPAGVSATWSGNTITISGTPTASGTFNYSILLTGGCGAVSATGTITVITSNTASGPSSTPTVCINTALTNITHTTTGATGIANSGVSGANGLPAGVSATWSGNTITISGTPTAAGTFNYSILLTGGCGSVSATGTITVTAANTASGPSSTPTVCINTAITNITHTTTGATGIANSGVSGANGLPAGVSATWSGGTITISGTPTVSGVFNYSILLTGGCGSVSATGTITVTAANTASGPSSTPTVCINTALTNITHTTTGATGIANSGVSGANGLPAGVSATWSGGTITISGTPTASGTFNYSILLTGGCGSVSATGTITVITSNTASGPSSTPTVCINTALTNITHTTTGATGIANSGVSGANGLPAGVSATWSGNTITISGTPTASGVFNYSILLTGGCNSVSATGTITVTAANTASGPSSTPTVCINTAITNITHTTTGATGIANSGVSGANGLPAGVSATWSGGTITISGTPTVSGVFNYSILLTGGCGTVSATGTITVTAANTASGPSSTPTVCINTALTNITHTTTGATGIANDGVSGANGLPAGVSATWSGGTITISGTPTASGVFNYSILLTGGCGAVSATGTITVNANNTASAASSTPTVCINTALTNITHTTTGATGIANSGVSGANGLPAGVSATWSGGTITISGTPTASGVFNYSILLTGGCGVANATGTITVTAANTASGPSSTPTLCVNTALTNITHTTTGATGIANSGVSGANGLPAGVSATWSGGTITISGTPTASGVFNYSILLTGGCGSVSASGTITVNATNTAGTASSSPSVCLNTAISPNITIATTGATGIANNGVSGANGLPAGVSASWSGNVITISGTPTASGVFNYSIPLTGGCGTVNATGTITVITTNTAAAPSSTPTVCQNTAISPNITIATTGATGIANSGVSGANGLPAGVSATWAANTITISGTPTASGVFNYSIPLTGGCGTVNATGTITVTAGGTASISGSTTVVQNSPSSPNVIFTGTGGSKPYTFTYTVNGGGNQTITTTGTNSTTTVPQSTATTGTFTYTLVSMQYANGCFAVITGPTTATITVVTALAQPDLQPTIPEPISSSFVASQTKNGYVQVTNGTANPTTGVVTFRISKPANFTLAIPPTMTLSGATSVNNTDWTITDSGFGYYNIVSTLPVAIPANSNIKIGYTLTAGVTINTSGIMTATVLDDTGGASPGAGDSDNTNNQSITVFSIN